MTETPAVLDLAERGRAKDGTPLTLDRRLFFQLQAFTGCVDHTSLVAALDDAALDAVLYENFHDPRGVALLTFAEDPGDLLAISRLVLNAPPFRDLALDRRYAMLGRTYSIGYESDLEETLLRRPRARVTDSTMPWAVWYPLRRRGSFERLSADEQRAALMEHGGIGHRFGAAGHAVDIRLACHGLDPQDNDFVVGLLGPALHPLSAVVQAMRRTIQTAVHIERMGPFFVGRAVRQGLPR